MYLKTHFISLISNPNLTCFDSHSLLDAKINNVLSLCHDQAILNAVQSIIQNMIACEDPSQQQLSYLQSTSPILLGIHNLSWPLNWP